MAAAFCCGKSVPAASRTADCRRALVCGWTRGYKKGACNIARYLHVHMVMENHACDVRRRLTCFMLLSPARNPLESTSSLVMPIQSKHSIICVEISTRPVSENLEKGRSAGLDILGVNPSTTSLQGEVRMILRSSINVVRPTAKTPAGMHVAMRAARGRFTAQISQQGSASHTQLSAHITCSAATPEGSSHCLLGQP